ncbi:hypothetical protein H5407_16960 [Mitsuaria sp. WAJ17]|uniref:DUF5908 family protein n=1 Tax=Mitsuaria sp. WAJ17 TaxID=2761452 RepID=UPI001600257C|nr:DUF5908 family protein [Mitsuaria sp. WAJ17]MBB2486921.1 hypothetical protein [Mitsuaria sp. WAJ17]
MSLEVRQLVLKATVADEGDDVEGSGEGQARARADGEASPLDPELLKQEILAACRQWFQEALRQQRER